MKTIRIASQILSLLAATSLMACSSSVSDVIDNTVPAETQQLTIDGVDDTTWVYISLSKCEIVGSSALGDDTEDAQWKARTDWDVAFCGEMIRTNSGTSGIGSGGLQLVSNRSFNALDTAPEDGYVVDTDDQVIRH